MREAFGLVVGSVPLALVLSCGSFGASARDDAGSSPDASLTDSTTADTPVSMDGSTPDSPFPNTSRIVFVTRGKRFPSDLGGVAGADAFCALEAQTATLLTGKTFRAWISDTSSSAESRLKDTSTARAFVRTDGTLVAAGWTEFASDVHAAPIDRDAFGVVVTSTPEVWTATDATGNYADPGAGYASCAALTQNSVSDMAVVGALNDKGTAWSSKANFSCQFDAHVYCIEDR